MLLTWFGGAQGTQWRRIGLLVLFGAIGMGASSAQAALPKPSHVVIVMEENHSYSEIMGAGSSATYIKSLAAAGASFTDSHAIEHPSQPNYLDMFAGSNMGITSDTISGSTPWTGANLGADLRSAGYSFAGYSESMQAAGSLADSYSADSKNRYVRKHNPWSNWQASSPSGNQLPSSVNQTFAAFPTDYSKLPTVSFVIPDEQNDMHDGSIAAGDAWLSGKLGGLVSNLKQSNTLLIVTFDEDDSSQSNQIPTIFLGPMVKPGQYSEAINHYNVLHTIESMYGLTPTGNAASATLIADAFVVPEPASIVGGLALIALARRRR